MSDFALNDDVHDQSKNSKKKEFETFFRLFYSELCNFALGYIANRDVVEDLVQSVFLNIWEQKNIWNNFENAKAYLYRSVRNEALNYLKHEKVKRDAQPEIRLRINEWKENYKSGANEQKKIEIIREGVNQLPDRCREIYNLSRENGFSYKEISDVLGLSVKTVETQIGRALKSLRKFVAEHWDHSAF